MAIPVIGAVGKALFGTTARSAGTGLFAGLFASDVTETADDYGLPGQGVTDQVKWLVRAVVALIVVFVIGQLINVNV